LASGRQIAVLFIKRSMLPKIPVVFSLCKYLNLIGFAIPCHEHDRGCLLCIFYSRISALAEETGIGPGRILGHVMAHELGHGLLGPDAHEGYDVMQAKLPISDLSWKTLYFTSAQSKRIRTELLARNQEPRSAGVAERFPITLTAPEQ